MRINDNDSTALGFFVVLFLEFLSQLGNFTRQIFKHADEITFTIQLIIGVLTISLLIKKLFIKQKNT